MKTKKNIISIFAIAVLAVVLAVSCMACQTLKDGANEIKEKGEELIEKAKETVNTLELTFDNNPRLSLQMADNSSVYKDSYIVTAVFDTDFEDLKKATWHLSFLDDTLPEEVDDYISISPSDDTLSCTVSMIKPFDNTIMLLCANKFYPGVFSQCKIDCRARLKDTSDFSIYSRRLVSGSFEGHHPNLDVINRYYANQIGTIPCFGYSNRQETFACFHACGIECGAYEDYSVQLKSLYTIDCDVQFSVFVKPSESLYSALRNYEIAKDSLSEVELLLDQIGTTTYYSYKSIVNALVCDPISINDEGQVLRFARAVYSNKDSSYDLEYIIRASTEFESRDYVFKFKFDTSMIPGEDVVGVSINSNIVF